MVARRVDSMKYLRYHMIINEYDNLKEGEAWT